MKKFFSAILLIAAMAFSVSTFVSCNDLVEEVEDVTAQAGANAEAIKALQAQLESGLASANAAIKAAETAAEKVAAEAKAEAIEAALAELANLDAEHTEAINKLKADVEAIINGKVATLEAADKALETQLNALVKYLEFADDKSAVVEELIAQIKDLQEQLKNAGSVEDFKDDFDALMKKIEEDVDAELAVLGNIVSVIAAQIQDITFVPTLAGNQITYLGKVQLATLNANGLKTWQRTDDVKYVMATFEVRPATAVKNIKNLQFATTQTTPKPATKAVAAVEYFDATIIDSDDNGRILVLGEIKKGESSESKAVFNNTTLYSMALVVSDEKMVGEDDLGSYVSSDYVKVAGNGEAFEIGENIGWIQDDEFTQTWDKTISVQWDTKVKDSERAFFEGVSATEEDMVVNFKDAAILSFQEIKDIFGIEKPVVTFDEFDVKDSKSKIDTTGCDHFEYDETTGDVVKTELSIVTTNRKNFEAKAKLADTLTVKDLKRVNTVGDTRVAKIAGFKVNNVEVAGMSVKSTYEITYAGGDITISSLKGDIMLPWNWREGNEWTEIYELNNNGNQNHSHPFLGRMEQLTITSNSDVDLTKLYSKSSGGEQISPAGFIQLTGKAYTMDEEEAGIEANVWVRVLGPTIARLAGSTTTGTTNAEKNGLTFGTEEYYWVFEGVAYDQKGKKYTIGFNPTKKFITGAAPVFDPNSYKFESAVIPVNGYRTIKMTAEGLTPVTEILAKHPAYNVADDEMEDFMDKVTITMNSDAKVTTNAYKETVDEVDKNEELEHTSFVFETDWDADEEEEVATLTMPAGTHVYYDETLEIPTKVNIAGIEYDYIVNLKVVKPTWMKEYIKASSLLASEGGVVEVGFDKDNTTGAYVIPSDLDMRKFYDQNSEELKALKAGHIWPGTTAGTWVDETIAAEYDVYIEMANATAADKAAYWVVANKDLIKTALDTEAETVPDPIYVPIATVKDGTITWAYGMTTPGLADAWHLTVRPYFDNDNSKVDSAHGEHADRAYDLKLDTNSFKFRIKLATVADMTLPKKNVESARAEVSGLDVTIQLPEYVELTTDTYVASIEGEPNTVKETISATQKVLVVNKGSNVAAEQQYVFVGNGVVVENPYDGSKLADRWITGVEMTKYFVEDANGKYIATVTTGLNYSDPAHFTNEIPDNTDSSVQRYSLTWVPEFEVFGGDTSIDQTVASWNVGYYLNGTTGGTPLFAANNANGLKFLKLDWINQMVTTNGMGNVLLVDSSNQTPGHVGEYMHPDYQGLAKPADDAAESVKKDYVDDQKLIYEAPTDYIVTYDVYTGKLTLNNEALQANVKMAKDLEVTVPVVLDYNFGKPQVKSVKIVFTDKADEVNTDVPYLPFWNK